MESGQVDDDAEGPVGEEGDEAKKKKAGDESRHAEGVGDPDDSCSNDGVDEVRRGAEEARFLLGEAQHRRGAAGGNSRRRRLRIGGGAVIGKRRAPPHPAHAMSEKC